MALKSKGHVLSAKLSVCPICGTTRNPTSETCSYCGYIFEDQLTSGASIDQSDAATRSLDRVVSDKAKSQLSKSAKERVVKTHENVICKNSLAILEGSLFLTDRRLVFVVGQELDNDADVLKMFDEADTLSIPLDQVVTVTGNRGILRQSLTVVWHSPPDSPSTTKTEFLQKNRPKNMAEVQNAINEWVPLIENEAVSEFKTEQEDMIRSSATWDQLDTKVLQTLDATKWIGFFQLERDLEEKYGGSLDPDELEASCTRLVKGKLIEQDKYGMFFRKLPTSAEPAHA